MNRSSFILTILALHSMLVLGDRYLSHINSQHHPHLKSTTKAPLKSTSRDQISPVFRRKPFAKTELSPVYEGDESSSSSTTTVQPPPSADSSSLTSQRPDIFRKTRPAKAKKDKFYVGKEHFYDNKIDILQENDDLEIVEDEQADPTVEDESLETLSDEQKTEILVNDLKAAESSVENSESESDSEHFYDNDEYYYYDDVESEVVHSENPAAERPRQPEYYEEDFFENLEIRQRKRAERLRRMQERRRAWLQQKRRDYYKSFTRWRRPKIVASSPPRAEHTATRGRPQTRWRARQKRPQQPQVIQVEENRRHYDQIQSRETDGESTSLMRSLLGVRPFCVHDDAQFSCTFTPLCWMQGGVAMTGCDSMLYSCCVSHTIARRQDTFVGTGRAQKRVAKEILHNEPECGVTRHRQFAKRIIGGHKAKFAELPWQVHIRISSYQCGGVLLNRQYVATAAHCVHQAKLSQITVHLGEFDTKNTKKVYEPLDSKSFRVDHITLHPDFRYMLTQPDRYDVAVLKLDRPVEYQDNILPICLPTSDFDLVGKVGVVAGWGKTDNSFGKTGTNILHKVLVPIIENDRCRAWHRDKAIAVQLHEEMFCAGHKVGKQDACLGDSGGPLVINFDGRWTLIGITSAGFGCAVEKQPGIYHKVSKTAKWISQQIHRDSPR